MATTLPAKGADKKARPCEGGVGCVGQGSGVEHHVGAANVSLVDQRVKGARVDEQVLFKAVSFGDDAVLM